MTHGAVPPISQDAEESLKLWSLRYLREKDAGLKDGLPASTEDFVKYTVTSVLAVRPKKPAPVQVIEIRAEWHEGPTACLRRVTTSIDLDDLRMYYKSEVAKFKEIDLAKAEQKAKAEQAFATARATTPQMPEPKLPPAEPPKNIYGEPIGYYLADGRLSAYLNWELEHDSMKRLIAASSEGSYLTGSAMRVLDGRIICQCSEMLNQKHRLCRHLKHAYLTGKDGRIAGLKSVSSVHERPVKVPIGIGNFYITVKLRRLIDDETNKDVPFLGVISEMEMNLKTTINHPDRTEFLVADGEGMYGYIKYIEELLRDHSDFSRLINMQDTDLRSSWVMNGMGCSRRVHTPGLRQQIAAGLLRKNPNRTNWILATIACVLENKVCLPHNDLGAGHDVPDMDETF